MKEAMKRLIPVTKRRFRNEKVVSYFGALFALALVLPFTGVPQAQAAERFEQTSNDLPFYALIERGLVHNDGEWAAIAFFGHPMHPERL